MPAVVTEGASETRARHEMPVLTSLGLRAAAAGRLHSGFAGGLTPESAALRSAKWVPLLRLDLNGSAVFSGGAGNDHQVATRYFVRALHHLADWPNGVDDRGTCGVCHEALQRLKRTGAGRLIRQCKHIRLSRFEPAHGSFQDLHQALVEECYARRGSFPARSRALSRRRQPQLRCLPGYAQRLQPLCANTGGSVALHHSHRVIAGLFGGNCLRHVDDGLRGLADRTGSDHLIGEGVG
jgi:hypothetical protein